jgi:hypothetical protein
VPSHQRSDQDSARSTLSQHQQQSSPAFQPPAKARGVSSPPHSAASAASEVRGTAWAPCQAAARSSAVKRASRQPGSSSAIQPAMRLLPAPVNVQQPDLPAEHTALKA